MLQHLPILAFCGVAAAATAQTTVTVYFPAYDQDGLEASIVGVKDAVTTFAINCPSGSQSDSDDDDSECGMPSGLLLTYGPSTVGYHFTTAYEGDKTGESITALVIPNLLNKVHPTPC
jgi:hypothetical protein